MRGLLGIYYFKQDPSKSLSSPHTPTSRVCPTPDKEEAGEVRGRIKRTVTGERGGGFPQWGRVVSYIYYQNRIFYSNISGKWVYKRCKGYYLAFMPFEKKSLLILCYNYVTDLCPKSEIRTRSIGFYADIMRTLKRNGGHRMSATGHWFF
jgi:hypothetical protein